jgi:hypothetical protein
MATYQNIRLASYIAHSSAFELNTINKSSSDGFHYTYIQQTHCFHTLTEETQSRRHHCHEDASLDIENIDTPNSHYIRLRLRSPYLPGWYHTEFADSNRAYHHHATHLGYVAGTPTLHVLRWLRQHLLIMTSTLHRSDSIDEWLPYSQNMSRIIQTRVLIHCHPLPSLYETLPTPSHEFLLASYDMRRQRHTPVFAASALVFAEVSYWP